MRSVLLAVLAVGLMGSLLGCSKAHTDDSISNDIKASMFSDPRTKSASLSVVVKNGAVTLTGEVPDENARYEAFKIAKETPGVVNVEDQMSLPQTPAATPARTAQNSESAATSSPLSKRVRKREEQLLVRRPLAGSADNSPYDSSASGQNFAQQQPAESQPASTSAPVAAAASVPSPAPPRQPAVRQVSIPSGTPVHIQMIDSVDSATNHAGEMFHASLASPIVVNDETIVPAGSDVYVKLVNSSSAGHMTGRSELTLQLARLDFQGASYSLSSDDYHDVGKSRTTRTAETVGAGAAIGAVIGGILGHGKGAAIGAGVGGAGGAATEEATKSPQVHIASETKLTFILQQSVAVAYTPAP